MEKQEKIIEYIKSIYDPVAIVLAGSRASGNFSPTSDWDLYVFTQKKFEWGHETFEGELLDISVEKPADENFIFNTRHHPEEFLNILLDNSNGWVRTAVENTKSKYLAGPEPISGDENKRLKKIMLRYIQKIEGRKEVEGLSFYYLGIFYEIVLRLWFQVQNLWPISPHLALEHIKKNDPAFFSLLKKLSDSSDLEGQISSAKSLYGQLFKV